MHSFTHSQLFKHLQLATYLSVGLSTSFAATAASVKASPEIETVLVLGAQTKLDLEKEQTLTPGSVTLINGDELYSRNVSNLGDMLRYVPGVWTASGSTGDSTFFSSRGSNLDATSYDGNGVKLLQDGLPVTAADGNNHNRAMDPLSARFAVVAHGANALTYGASTLGGAIDFITPTARDTEPEIFVTGGDHRQLQGRITTGLVEGNFDGLVTLEARTWDGYRDQQHEQKRKGLYSNAGWKFGDKVQTRFYFTYIDNDQDLPGALTRDEFENNPYQAQAAAANGNYQYNVETMRAANKTVWDIDENSSLSIGFSYEEQSLYHPIVYNPFFSLLIDTDQNNAGTSLRYNIRLNDHDLLAGLNYGETRVKGGNYSHERGRRTNLMTDVDNNADSLEIFLVDRWQIAQDWKLVYGAQAISANREVKNSNVANGALYNPQGKFDSINPRVGVLHQFSESTEFFANLSRLYEAPTNYELEDDASPDDKVLDAMKGEVLEIGTRGTKALGANNQWRWDVAFYYSELRNEILSIDNPQAPGTSLSTNVDDTIHAGVEALIGASFALANNARIEPVVSITINQFSFDNDRNYGDNELPAAPGYAIKGEVLYRTANGFFVGPTFDLVDERYADFNNTYRIDAYSLIGLRTGFSMGDWEVYGEARNLIDKKYVGVHSVRDQARPTDAILQPGEPRSLYIGAKLKF